MQVVAGADVVAGEHVQAFLPGFPPGNRAHTVTGDLGVSEWTFRGARSDGARTEAEGCDLFTFRAGKIALKRAFRKQRPLLPA